MKKDLKGRARAFGAVTVVNAIPAKKGVAIGVKLETKAEVELVEGEEEVIVEILNNPQENPELVKEAVKATLRYFKATEYGARVKTFSEIPIARGLKSSSAAANATVLATAYALKRKIKDLEAVKLGVEASLKAKVSVTGALDDASASFFGGIVFTDNLKKKLIRREELREFKVVILVPKKKVYTIKVNVKKMEKLSSLSEEAFNLALKGKYWEASFLNGLLISAVLNLETAPLIEAVETGALTAGVSGTGPSMFAICEKETCREIIERWREFKGELIVTEVNSKNKAGKW